MSQTVTTSNGWDLIAAASQDGLNAQLTKLPAMPVRMDIPLEFLGLEKALIDITLDIPAAELAALIQVLKTVVKQSLKNGKEYKLASFSLSNEDVQQYKSLIPYVADFSFVQDTTNPGRSNLLVLMQTDFMVLVSNKPFLQYFVMPPMIENMKSQAKHPEDVPNQIAITKLTVPDLYQVQNTQDIGLDKDHDPWVSTMTGCIDTQAQALCFYLDVKADVTFLNFRVDAWDKSWQQFQVDDKENITLVQVNEDKGKSTTAEWWEWLLASLSFASGLVVGIMFAVVQVNAPDLGGTFIETAPLIVKWPNQKVVTLKSMRTPNHVVLDIAVDFFD
ncbi:uncharacterized protein CDV56_104226 [Aspergillus thermomutatus]|uniref:Uncharacterized protein n=1 Tax=Aspergillus thermomutatus TaxID=41047 RepID=A0A397G6K6_ASPTH|nr:uncharacterized protein CDV56_104226 [Aspergillus thermomutatus]RHZ45474.1 hypothetical protein CDV56_104226 [Aspergillus thermomutatus]